MWFLPAHSSCAQVLMSSNPSQFSLIHIHLHIPIAGAVRFAIVSNEPVKLLPIRSQTYFSLILSRSDALGLLARSCSPEICLGRSRGPGIGRTQAGTEVVDPKPKSASEYLINVISSSTPPPPPPPPPDAFTFLHLSMRAQ